MGNLVVVRRERLEHYTVCMVISPCWEGGAGGEPVGGEEGGAGALHCVYGNISLLGRWGLWGTWWW